MPTDPNLEELERLLARATPGPWSKQEQKYLKELWGGLCKVSGWIICVFSDTDDGDVPISIKWDDPDYTERANANAELVTALRNAAPTLIATARECERLRTALRNIADAPACGPDGRLFYEVQTEDGQMGVMDVDPLGWIADATTKARAALADPATPGREASNAPAVCTDPQRPLG